MFTNKPFSSSGEVFDWVSGFINLEKGQIPRSFNLDRMKFLAQAAGNPERCAPCIHIAGSKGKGSVTGMAASILEAAGFRPARYMSPHVSDFRERISLGNSFFDESIYCAAGDELRAITESAAVKKAELFDPANGGAPTFFELLTLFFFLCARRADCGAMVVETGLGGRLDSTNIVDPLVSIITLIELEHTAFLGETISAVAGEKAGIIKKGRPVVLAKQYDEVLEVFRQKAAETGSPLLYFPEAAEIRDLRIHRGGTDFTFSYKKGGGQSALPLAVSTPGSIQAENAALAIMALNSAFPRLDADAVRRGLECFGLPARFELLAQDPPLVIDGAHTPESAAACVETFCKLYGEGGVLLFGCAADKNAEAMAQVMAPHFSRIIISAPGSFKASDPRRAYEAFLAAVCRQKENAPAQGGETEKPALMPETTAAIRHALETSKSKPLPLLGAGSFYLAAEIIAFLKKNKP
jgi:dihydrofolate synthase/folylpolyglutamate synthase